VLAALLVAAVGAVAGHDTVSAMSGDDERDARDIAALDIDYQAAVERNDAERMAEILHPRFELVFGDGRRLGRDEVLRQARERHVQYERQVEDPGTQRVRVDGDVAIVTARLWCRGAHNGRRFDFRLWFSDVYVRTDQGWRYLFGQASLPLGVVDVNPASGH